MKGTETKGRRNSPLAWAYRLGAGEGSKGGSAVEDASFLAPDGSKWSHEGTVAKGWQRVSTDTYPGGLKAWVETFTPLQLSKQVVLTMPIEVNPDLAQEWLEAQQPLIEAVEWWQAWQGSHAGPLNTPGFRKHFPRMLSECNAGKYGKACWARSACKNPDVGKDPIGSGKYQARVPHHPLEVKHAGISSPGTEV